METKRVKTEWGEEIDIVVSDCCYYCKYYEQDGEDYEAGIEAYQICNKGYSNLKGFPFLRKAKCFEPDGVKRF